MNKLLGKKFASFKGIADGFGEFENEEEAPTTKLRRAGSPVRSADTDRLLVAFAAAPLDQTYSSKEVSKIIGKGLKTLSRLRKDKKIAYTYDGGAVRYSKKHIEGYRKKYEVRSA
jgi:hypothetical protein